MPSQNRPRLEALSSLRFFAALGVFFVHAFAMHILEKTDAPKWFLQLSSLGYMAVSFFFVLSGFVLVYSYSDREIGFTRFMRSRLARLYPAYLVGLLLAAPFFFYAINLMDIPDYRWFSAHQGLTVFLHVTMLQGWVPQAVIGWNAPGWALSAFVFFYVAYLPLSKWMSKLSLPRIFAFAAGAWLCSVAASIAYVIVKPDHVQYANAFHILLPWLNVLKFNPLVRLPEFLLGMALGFAVLRSKPDPRRSSLFIAAGVAFLLLLYAISPLVPYPIMHTGLSAPAFMLIVYGLAAPPRWTSILTTRPLVLLGDASLSFYLLHSTILGMVVFSRPNAPVTWRPILLALCITTAVSVALYKLFEIPARELFDPKPIAKLAGAAASA